MLLLAGQYEEGWHEYEWRWLCASHAHRQRRFSVPRWDGQPAPGRTILVHAEQGFGDALQFVRYLPLIIERAGGSGIILECRPEQASLFKQFESPRMRVVERSASDETLPPFDLHLPLLSAPLTLREFAPLPAKAPYLVADSKLRDRWRRRLGCEAKFRVGLAWAGDPGHGHDRRRSIPPEKLSPLLEVPGIEFVSLQVAGDPLPAKLADSGIRDFRKEIADFSDPAALIAELDLVITVDTATAHLAGALGRPVWVLLPFVPDWRWGVAREDSPWYPSMRLFRQFEPGEWDDVVQRVIAEIRAHPVGSFALRC